MWTPSLAEAAGKERFVKVYRPNGMDGWDEAATCWVVTAEREQAELRKSIAAVHCNPDDFWLKQQGTSR